MSGRIYRETFQSDPGGWFGLVSNHEGPKALQWSSGQITSSSPWWIDYNHAPPGAGYLHMIAVLLTAGKGYGEAYRDAGGLNRFIEDGMPTDFTNARLTFRLKGELESREARLALLVQATATSGITSGWLLTGAPLNVTADWTEQTVVAVPDETQWTCLGARHDRTHSYGHLPLAEVLRHVNADIMLTLFPLNVVPMGPIAGDPHWLRAGRDYPVWRSRLPEGYVTISEVRIEFTA